MVGCVWDVVVFEECGERFGSAGDSFVFFCLFLFPFFFVSTPLMMMSFVRVYRLRKYNSDEVILMIHGSK